MEKTFFLIEKDYRTGKSEVIMEGSFNECYNHACHCLSEVFGLLYNPDTELWNKQNGTVIIQDNLNGSWDVSDNIKLFIDHECTTL